MTDHLRRANEAGEDISADVARVEREAEADEKVWIVSVPIQVTADSKEQAIQLALADMRDPSMEWTWFDVRQTSGPHKKVPHGLCPVCGHYGNDCEGGEG